MKSHTTLRWCASILLAITLLFVASLWCAGSLLIHPAQRSVGSPPADLPTRSVSFHSASSSLIHGWFAAGEPGRGAVLLLHGVRASRLSMLDRARFLHTAGYAVLLIDFQASGESPGNAISFGYREAYDVQAAVDQLKQRAPGERIGIIAISMGGAATLLATPPVKVDAMVLEQVYPTIAQALQDRLTLYLGSTAGRWLTPPLLATLQLHLGIGSSQLRPIDHVAALTVPKLMIVGDQDQHTRLDESRAMFAAAANPKQLWIVHGAAHVDIYRYAGAVYKIRVLAFLDAWLQQPQTTP